MKIRIARDLYVNSNTLFRFEWRKYYPILVIHEKFESILKWLLRIITIIGIATSVITIEIWYYSLGLSILIFIVEQFLERTAIEYTTMIIQPFPNFEIDYNQWKTNGFKIPIEKNDKDLACFGPSYKDETYAIKFFTYLRSWLNENNNDDISNNLIVSLVIEPNEKYTTYIYANLGRKRLDYMFKDIGSKNKISKYGKRQQRFIAQMFYWHTLDFKDGYFIKQFLEFQNSQKPYYFTPSVLQPFDLPPKFLEEYSIKKYHLLVKKRSEVKKFDPEYYFTPSLKKVKKSDTPVKKNIDIIYNEIETILSKSEDIGFMPNSGNNVGAITLCFSEPDLPYIAYKKLIESKSDADVEIYIKENEGFVDITIKIESLKKQINLKKLLYNKAQLNSFKLVKGGGQYILLLIGFPPAENNHIIMEHDLKPLIAKWEIE